MSHQLRRRARPVFPGAPFCALVIVVGLLAAACGDDQPSARDRSVPPASPSVTPAPTDSSPVPEPTPGFVEPVPGRRERRVPWRFVEDSAGPAVVVEVQAGGPPCDVVTDLSVSESPEAVELTVWAGRTPGARCRGVPALRGTFRVRVPLTEPLGDRPLRRG